MTRKTTNAGTSDEAGVGGQVWFLSETGDGRKTLDKEALD